ncbi:hypothetical protein HK104_001718 [Borealophlyctis nickersoniae]|nr:hypothetical protein HK104_001718 [Borealophlyctis nickersoniae]
MQKHEHIKATVVARHGIARRNIGVCREYTIDVALSLADDKLQPTQQPCTLTVEDDSPMIYLMRKNLRRLATNRPYPMMEEHLLGRRVDVSGMSPTVASYKGLSLTEEQRRAVQMMASHPITLIHGPAGTGKSRALEAYLRAVVEETRDKPGVLAAYVGPSNATADAFLLKIWALATDESGIVLDLHNPEVGRIDDRLDCMNMDRQIERAAQAMTEGLEDKKGPWKYCWAMHRMRVVLVQRVVATASMLLLKWKDVFADCGKKLLHLVVDEAPAVIEPLVLADLTRDTRRLALCGDLRQLPPYVAQDEPLSASLSVSTFERFYMIDTVPVVSLTEQHRLPKILNDVLKEEGDTHMVPSRRLVYEWRKDPIPVYGESNDDWGALGRAFGNGLAVIAVAGNESYDSRVKTSLINIPEARIVETVLMKLFKADKVQMKDVLVYTPYTGQKWLLEAELYEEVLQKVRIHTLDTVASTEKDFCVFSGVRARNNSHAGFLTDHRRSRVLNSRAVKGQLLIIDTDVYWRVPYSRTVIEVARRDQRLFSWKGGQRVSGCKLDLDATVMTRPRIVGVPVRVLSNKVVEPIRLQRPASSETAGSSSSLTRQEDPRPEREEQQRRSSRTHGCSPSAGTTRGNDSAARCVETPCTRTIQLSITKPRQDPRRAGSLGTTRPTDLNLVDHKIAVGIEFRPPRTLQIPEEIVKEHNGRRGRFGLRGQVAHQNTYDVPRVDFDIKGLEWDEGHSPARILLSAERVDCENGFLEWQRIIRAILQGGDTVRLYPFKDEYTLRGFMEAYNTVSGRG